MIAPYLEVVVVLAFWLKEMVWGSRGVVHVGLSWRVCMCDRGISRQGAGPVKRQFARGSSRPRLSMTTNATIMMVKTAVLLLLKGATVGDLEYEFVRK